MTPDEEPDLSALVAELGALSGPGATRDTTFVIMRGRFRIGVKYNAGSSCFVELASRYDGVAQVRPAQL